VKEAIDCYDLVLNSLDDSENQELKKYHILAEKEKNSLETV